MTDLLFYLSKVLSVFTHPLIWAAVLFLLAFWTRSRHRVIARWLLLAAFGWAALVDWLPLPEALLRELESRQPAPAMVAAGQLQHYKGVVVLGGSTERLKVAVTLLRQHPNLQLLFTGGDGKWWASGPTEADQAEAFFKRMGLSPERTLYERASRTTHENAVLGAAVPGVDMTQPWLLLTSARHMPRAMSIFQTVGWNVTPFPLDYRSTRLGSWTDYSLARGMTRWQLVLHEWLGMVAIPVIAVGALLRSVQWRLA